MAGGEGFARIRPDSTGARIRTVEEEEKLQADGYTRADIETQVVILSDADGNLIDDRHAFSVRSPVIEGILKDILSELKVHSDLLRQLTS